MYTTPPISARPIRLWRHILTLTLVWTAIIGFSLVLVLNHGRAEFHAFPAHKETEIAWHGLMWLIGLGGLWLMARSLRRRIDERDRGLWYLKKERDFAAAVIDTAGALVIVLDGHGCIARFNRSCERATGYTAAEVLGHPFWDFLVAAEERDAVKEEFARIKGIKDWHSTLEYESNWVTKQGRLRRIAWSNTALLDERGEVEYVIGTGLDLTARLQTEARLKVNEEKFRCLFENCNDAIFIAAAETGRIVDANAAAATLTGRARADLIGLHQRELHPSDTPAECAKIFADYHNAVNRLVACDVLRADEERVPVEISASVFTLDGRTMIQGVFRDISERRRVEEERKKLEEKLQHGQKLESLGVLAGGIAHDFNNLLMGVLGYADLALSELAAESPARDSVQQIVTAAMRAAELTKQMLAYSGRGRFVIELLDLTRLVEEMIHLLQVSISKKAVMRFNFTSNLPPVEADATQIRQVIMNLITNASDAIGEKSGLITISTGVMELDHTYLGTTYMDEGMAEGYYNYVEVSDTGCGMDAETKARIFDPFFTTKFTGRGLGLAAVLGIVRGHHGGIKVYSEPGRGTTFKVLLPCKTEALMDAAGPPPELLRRRARGTILVVDDEETVRAVAKMTLERVGISVLTASDGREAVELFIQQAERIDLVILDMMMPHMNGEETFRELKLLRPEVRVLLSSGYNEQEATGRFAGKGLAGFIQKPYRARDLLDTVAQLLQ